MADQVIKVDLESLDIKKQNLEKLKEVFPAAFAEGKVDFKKLEQLLGEDVEKGAERYGLNWPGKSNAIKEISAPSLGTLKPDRSESVNFDNTENLFIEADNLEALKLLQKSYLGKIKMIYIDPPYNTGKDFVYKDNFGETLKDYLEFTQQKDEDGKVFSTNPDSAGRFHSNWLNMMYPRLYLARNLLTPDGVIFISIGKEELSNLLSLCNQIFGEQNKIGVCSRVMKTGGNKGVFFSPNIDYVLVYARDISKSSPFRDELPEKLVSQIYTQVELEGNRKGEKYREMGLYQAGLDIRPNQRYWIKCPDGTLVIPPGSNFPTSTSEGEKVVPTGGDGVWRWSLDRFTQEIKNNNIVFKKTATSSLLDQDKNKAKWNIYTKIWLNDRIEDGRVPTDLITGVENRQSSAELKDLDIPFDFPKPTKLIAFLARILRSDDITVLDFFAGSCSTAHAILDMNNEDGGSRKFIVVQLPEPTDENSESFKAGFKTIADIGKERIRRVIAKIEESSGDKLKLNSKSQDLGFKVFKLDKSNFNVWDGTDPENLDAQLQLGVDRVDASSSEEDILYEVMLKDGFMLSEKPEIKTVDNKKVYSFGGGFLLVCLEKKLTKEFIKQMAEMMPKTESDATVIFLDEGFHDNDQLLVNAVEIFKSRNEKINFRIV